MTHLKSELHDFKQDQKTKNGILSAQGTVPAKTSHLNVSYGDGLGASGTEMREIGLTN